MVATKKKSSTPRTLSVPMYRPKSLLDQTQLENWFTGTTVGLHMTKPQMEAVKAQGLNDPSDLFDMSKEDITRLFETLKSRTYDETGKQLPTYVLTSRTVSRLHVCAEIVKYLSLVNRDITWSAITWESAQIFKEEWKTIEEAAAAKATASPKSKNVPIMEWIYSFIDWTKATVGKNYCPLFYLIADEDDRDKTKPEDAPLLIPGHHFGGDRRSIKDEIMARVSTNTAAARSDNETLFDALCTSFANSPLASTVAQYNESRDGVALWNHIISTYAHSSLHEKVGKDAKSWMETTRWNGPQDGPLSTFVDKHAKQFNIYERASRNSRLDEISERQRVTWLLEGITSQDPIVLVAKAHILAQDGTGEDKRNRWELASVHMSQVDYAGKQKGSGRRKARMVDAEVSGVSAGGGGGGRRRNKKARLETDAAYKAMLNLKGGTGKTGVDLRYYEKSEFIKLPKNQKKELLEWRATELAKQNITLSEGGKGKKGKGGASLSSVTAIVASQFAILKDGIIDEVKGLLGSPRKPTPEEAAAAAVTAGIEAYKKATATADVGSTVSFVIPPVGEETAVGTAVVGGTATAPIDDATNPESPNALDIGLDAKVSEAASVGLQGILKLNGRKND